MLVDNTIAVENLRKLAASQKADYKFRKREKRNMKLSLPYSRKRMKPRVQETVELENCSIKTGKKTVVVLSSDKMGEGEEKLGKILIKGFVYALTQLEQLPRLYCFITAAPFYHVRILRFWRT